ncbi:SDR family NAD(P)-dependent oxidoreductase [Sphingomonas montanisoli]|uniref:SDR family oxidoreductase n=1 Tax=Sphingomonas montanisoli TaxID=2606412 RepID=A0A5D9C7M8_9SPHN|nr:glucose 1-dehydrogenase [Sphingomonas montanisoli]TZG27699.1 SDR family oxidoreductase [Sphingomonas montanisoli]
MRFKDKVALVTGAASGIGAATARLMAAEGATIFAVDIAADRLDAFVTELGGKATGHVADLSDGAQAEAMVDACIATFGRLDILVNNAGIGALGKAADLDPAMWRKVMAIDLDAVFLASRKALPHLIEAKGNIVTTASISGMGADYGFTAYNSAKAGVLGLTRNLAIDYAAQGVRVNAVSPGPIDTPLMAHMPAELLAEFGRVTPMRRVGKAEEIAKVIAFVASDDAAYLTGQNIAVDGGLTAHTGQPDIVGFLTQAYSR